MGKRHSGQVKRDPEFRIIIIFESVISAPSALSAVNILVFARKE